MSSADPERRPTTAAVVGCGDISAMHLAALTGPDRRLLAVCDTDPDRLAATTGRYDVPGFADHRTLLAEVRPDVLHVCTPHDQHAPVIIDALAAGVHVITEKPLAATVAAAERVVAAAHEHPGTKIGVCFQNRYNATSVAMRELVDSGELGAIRGAAATVLWHRTPAYYAARPWRGRREQSGGGVLVNQAIHTVDLLTWLLGPAVEVTGHAATYAPELAAVIDVEDTADVIITHAGGVRSSLFATTTHAADAPVTIEVVAEHATLRLAGDLTVTWADGRTEVVAEPAPANAPGGRAYWGASHERLITDFHARLEDPEPFWIGPADGLAALRILNAIYSRSAPVSSEW